MLGLGGKKKSAGSAFRFRVSDVVDVPLRGTLLRLRLAEGTPSMNDLGVGSSLKLQSVTGTERTVRIIAHAVTGGAATQARLDRVGELDVMVSDEDAVGSEAIDIGWMASGPVS